MGMPNFELMQLPLNEDGDEAIVGLGKEVNVSDLVAGFEYLRGTGEYTAKLQASVGGQIWVDVSTLAVDVSGKIDAFYNVARVNVSVAGAIGTSRLSYHGKS